MCEPDQEMYVQPSTQIHSLASFRQQALPSGCDKSVLDVCVKEDTTWSAVISIILNWS